MAWISRRTFLASGLSTLALRAQTPADAPLRWALFSDTHIPEKAEETYRNFNPQANLKAVAAQVAQAPVTGAVICGDLARLAGLPGDYAALARLLKPVTDKMPTALALGNHDHRKNFLAQFANPAGAAKVNNRHVVVVEAPAVRVVVLDSLLEPNVTPGQLGRAQRDWLTRFLAESPVRPTFLFVHHTLDDGDGSLVDAERLLNIVRGHGSVKAIFYGHSHRYSFDTFGGVHLINIPAVGYNFADSEPVGWLDAELTPRTGAFTLHAIGGDKSKDGKRVELTWRA